MSGEDVKASADVATGTGAAHGAPTRLTGEVESYGPKRLEARELGRGGRPSKRRERLAKLETEIARRKRDRKDLGLKWVALAVSRDEKQVARDVHRAGWKEWTLFVDQVPPAE